MDKFWFLCQNNCHNEYQHSKKKILERMFLFRACSSSLFNLRNWRCAVYHVSSLISVSFYWKVICLIGVHCVFFLAARTVGFTVIMWLRVPGCFSSALLFLVELSLYWIFLCCILACLVFRLSFSFWAASCLFSQALGFLICSSVHSGQHRDHRSEWGELLLHGDLSFSAAHCNPSV